MQKKHIILIIQVFCLATFLGGFVLAQPSHNSDGCQDPLLAAQSEEKKVSVDASGNATLIDEDTLTEADDLAGTCPKGFHCSCPGCPLYSDSDEDLFCDLGEEPDEQAGS